LRRLIGADSRRKGGKHLTVRPAHLRQIADLARSVQSALDLEAVLSRVTAAVTALRPDLLCIIRLVDPPAGGYRLVATGGAGAEGNAPLVRFGEGLTGVVAQTRRSLFVEDTLVDSRTASKDWYATRGFAAYYGVPIDAADELLGVLNVNFPRGEPPTPEEREIIDLFAIHAAVAIRNARLFEAVRQERRRLEVLSEVSARVASVHDTDEVLDLIVNEAVRILAADAGGLRLLEGNDLVLRARTASATSLITRPRFKIGESLSGLPVASGEATAVEDVREDERYDPIHRRAARELGFHSFLGVPLRAHGRVLGSLYVYTLRHRRFAPDEVSLLSAFADQASLVIDKDRLIQEARSRATRLRTLARLHQLVSASLDTNEVLRAIAGAAAELMDAPLASIYTADEPAGMLERRAFSNDTLGDDHPGVRRRFGEGAIGWTAVHRRPLDVPDVLADDRVLSQAWCRRHGLASALLLPVLFQDALVAVLVLFGRAPFVLDTADQDLLDSFLAQAALAIHNASVHEQLRVAHQNLERSQEQLIHSEKLSALGQLVAGVAHELNNPLSAVLGNAYLAEAKASDPRIQRHINGIREGAERASQIVRNLLQFARKLTSSREDMDINDVIERVLALVANTAVTQNISVVRDLAPHLPMTAGDPGQIQQVVLNLVTNAFQAMADAGGRLTVRSRPLGGRLHVEVEDTGPGIPAEIRTRIFDPFFTTKAVGQGTGLGLSVAHGIVSAHEGRIWAEEAPAGGARFVIELPVRSATPAVAETDEPPIPRGARLLVVDDEEHVAQVLGDLLEELGARVTIAHSAREARELLGCERFHLITLDVIMPGENGTDFWRELRDKDPGAAARVVFVTGTVDPSILAFVESTGRPVLAKPYSLKALQTLIATELGR
jgi:signal transduction histidine kinase/putative methionine-R-sulfoxide reductase with GAF domain